MSEVVRFNMFPSGQPNPASNGLYVRHEDYTRLEQECDRLRSLWELELDRATTAENESAIKQWALEEARRVLGKCQEMLDPHRDAVLWGEVCDAFKVKS